jgi:hypothetical protein
MQKHNNFTQPGKIVKCQIARSLSEPSRDGIIAALSFIVSFRAHGGRKESLLHKAETLRRAQGDRYEGKA